ncbi:MAG: nuclear transport factor 2 family protein [Jatrophihabitantaceae bacterium]
MSKSPILELVDIIDQNRWQDLSTVLAPDCVIERPGSEPLVGLERIERFYREERPIVSGLHKLDQVVADSEAGACWGTFSGTTKDGGSVEARFADTFTLKAGLITRRTTYVHGKGH